MTKNLPTNREDFYQREVNGLDCFVVSVVVVMGILFALLALLMISVG